MSCSTSTTEKRPLSRRKSPTRRAVSSRPVPAIGSSSNRTLGCIASAMASSSARFSPCASSPAIICARSARPTSASAASAGPLKPGSAGAPTAEPPHERARQAEKTAARKQNDEHEHRSEDHLPVLGDTGEPLLGQEVGGSPDDRAVKRTQSAEQHHNDQLARALPGHV